MAESAQKMARTERHPDTLYFEPQGGACVASCHHTKCDEMRTVVKKLGHASCVAFDPSYLKFAFKYLKSLDNLAANAEQVFVISADDGSFGKTQEEEMAMLREKGIAFSIVTLDDYKRKFMDQAIGTSPAARQNFKLQVVDGGSVKEHDFEGFLTSHSYHEKDTRDSDSVYASICKHNLSVFTMVSVTSDTFKLQVVDGGSVKEHDFAGFLTSHACHEKDTRDSDSVYASICKRNFSVFKIVPL